MTDSLSPSTTKSNFIRMPRVRCFQALHDELKEMRNFPPRQMIHQFSQPPLTRDGVWKKGARKTGSNGMQNQTSRKFSVCQDVLGNDELRTGMPKKISSVLCSIHCRVQLFPKKSHSAKRSQVDVHFAISLSPSVLGRSFYSDINLLAFIVLTSFFLCAIIHHFFMQFIRARYGSGCYRCNGVLTSHQVNFQ